MTVCKLAQLFFKIVVAQCRHVAVFILMPSNKLIGTCSKGCHKFKCEKSAFIYEMITIDVVNVMIQSYIQRRY